MSIKKSNNSLTHPHWFSPYVINFYMVNCFGTLMAGWVSGTLSLSQKHHFPSSDGSSGFPLSLQTFQKWSWEGLGDALLFAI